MNEKKYQGQVRISGKTYSVEVFDGERFIDGVTVAEFMQRLSPVERDEMAAIGRKALQDEKNGSPSNTLQQTADAFHSRRVN